MAFGKKYFSSYKSNNNLDYYLEIFLEDYTGSALELVMGAGGPVIEYETDQEDRFSPIISSSCKIPYLVENYLDSLFIDDLRNNYQERQVYVHIYRSTQSGHSAVAPLWSGFLVMDIGSGVDKYFPYEEHLKFVDGLSLLKDIDFVDLGAAGGTPPFEERVQGNYAQENMYFGPATYIYWIREILAKSGAALTNQGASQNYGFTTSINWYNGEMNATGQSSDPLHKTKCAVSMFHRKDDQGVFYPDNCYNVLKELLRHWGARITYWKHEFWIVQIPEYITNESGTISTPVNNNSRLYSNTGAYQGSQNHLGSTYFTRYEQTIENDKISKLSGTKYDYLPLIKQVNADFLSFSSKSYYGGFPFGGTATTQEVFQGTINSPSAANFLFLSIPLDWTWDLSNAPNFPNGHTNGWWCAIKFNFYAAQEDPNTGVITTYYLQYNSANGGRYYWVDSANWTPLGNRAPKYIISSKLTDVYGHIGFEQQIPFVDENGNAISMSGAWNFFLDIDDYGTGSQNPGSFYLNFSGYGSPQRMRNPGTAIQLPAGSGIMSGTVSWSNTLVDQQGQVTISTISNPAGFNAGTANPDIRFATTSPFTGLLQTLNNAQSASNGETFNVINSNTQAKQNSEQYNFGTLLWGDSLEFAPSSLQVFNGSTYVNTEPSGEWGRGVLTGTKTFTAMLIDEFFSGQTKIIISPSMRLAVGVANKNEDQSGTIRPRYVNPIGKLRETRDGTDPEYFFRRGSFYTLLDEWDYEGYQIIRDVPTTTTQSNGMGSMGGSQSGSPASSGMSPSPMAQALSQNSPLAYIRTTIPSTGSNVAVNGNFNTAVGWSLGTGWSIDTTAKKAKFAATGSTSELTQSVLTEGLTYQVNFKVEVTAGTLLVKAGTSGTSQSITSSGDYSIYLDCEGSSLIKFQAGTTFTGNITYITLKDQKSLSSVPIEAIGSAVFKTGDTFNLINSNDDTILPLTVTSNQGSGDTTISVSSTPLYEDIDNGSYLLINQDDLSEQYQNKTKGTVGGFDITATSIDSGSVSIGSYIDDDTFGTASATSLATSESIKAYVDGQVGASDTLQEVTDNGNTTTNSIMIGSSSSPAQLLHVYGSSNATAQIEGNSGLATMRLISGSYTTGYDMLLDTGGTAYLFNRNNGNLSFGTNNSEKMRLTSAGYLGILTTSPSSPLTVAGRVDFQSDLRLRGTDSLLNQGVVRFFVDSNNKLYIDTANDGANLFAIDSSGQVTIPATPVASTDAASKSYVDAQVGSADTLQEVTDNGNTTTNAITFAGGTSTGDITGQSITLGDGSTDEKLRVYYSDNSYIDLHGYGLYLNRSVSYIRPNSNNSISLFIGSSTQNFSNIRNHAVTHNWFDASSELMRLNSTGLGIGTTSPQELLHLFQQNHSNPLLIEVENDGYLAGTSAGIKLTSKATDGVSGSWTIDNLNRDTLRFLDDGSEKMRLTSGGNLLIGTTTDNGHKLQVNGDIQIGDGDILRIGDSSDLKLYHTGTGTVIQNAVGNLTIQQDQNDGDIVFRCDDGSGGTTPYITLDGGFSVPYVALEDSTILALGTQKDFLFTHDSTDSKIDNMITGDIKIRNFANDKDIRLATDNGTGGVTDYIRLDGSQTTINLYKNVLIGTTSDSGEKLVVNGNAKFADQVTIPATPVASTDAASKSYVDAQVGSADTLQEVTDNGNTTTNSIMIGSSSSPDHTLRVSGDARIGNLHVKTSNFGAGGTGKSIFADGAGSGLLGFNSTTGFGYFIGTAEKMRLTSGGNLLIGGTSDTDKLVVEDATAPNIRMYRSGIGQVWQQTIDSSGRYMLREAASAGGTKYTRLQIDDTGEVEVFNTFTGTTANFSGNVSIGGTAGAVYKLDIVGKQRVQSVLELEDVLTLNAISTPSDPASGKSSIYMDSADGAIKVKINVGGTVVTRTIASFE